MLVSLWSLKGGVGCSVTSALLALHAARRDPAGVVLVDLDGDQPLVLGCPPSDGPGVTDWLGVDNAPPDELGRLVHDVAPGLGLIERGRSSWVDAPALDALVGHLAAYPGLVLVDAGSVLGVGPRARAARQLAAQATRSILVTRACYLALSRLSDAPVAPSGVILVREAGRALGVDDVEAAAHAPVVAEIDIDSAIARAVDAGLLASRPPRGLERALRAVA